MSGNFKLQSATIDLEATLGEIVEAIRLAGFTGGLNSAHNMKDDLSSAVSCETLSDFRTHLEAALQKLPLLTETLRNGRREVEEDAYAVAHLENALDALKPLERELVEMLDGIVELEAADGNTEEEDEN